MDNYELNLKNKLNYIVSVVSYYGVMRVPLDYFDVSVVSNEGELGKNNQIHGYGTMYKMRSLLAMYPRLVDDILAKYNMSFRKNKKEYVFTLKSVPVYPQQM